MVALSYLTRSGFRWAIIAVIAGIVAEWTGRLTGPVYGAHWSNRWNRLTELLTIFGQLTVDCGLIGLLVMFYLHARQQVMGAGICMMPKTRPANIAVAGGFLVLLAAVVARFAAYEMSYSSLLGEFAGWLGVLILVGYAVCRPWLLPVLVIAGFLIFQHTTFPRHLRDLTTDYQRLYADEADNQQIEEAQSHSEAARANEMAGRFKQAHEQGNKPFQETLVELQQANASLKTAYGGWSSVYYDYLTELRIIFLLADALALLGLGWIARPATFRISVLERIRRLRPVSLDAVKAPIAERRHQFISSQFSRRLHRRFAVHDWRAAIVAAVAMLGLTGLFNLQWARSTGYAAPSVAFNNEWFNAQFGQSAPAGLTMILAFLPAVLVAIGWRERWANFDFESLYPVSRRQFVSDLASGLLLDAAEFWSAATIAMLVTCLCMRAGFLHDGRFWVAVLCGAMMQFGWLGGVFLIGQRRNTLSYIAGLIPFAMAMFLPLDAMWRESHPMKPGLMLLIASAEMVIGLLLFGVAHYTASRRTYA